MFAMLAECLWPCHVEAAMTINLMPWRGAEERRRTRRFRLQLYGALGLAGLLVLAEWSLLGQKTAISQQRRQHIEAAMGDLQRQLPELKRLQQLLAVREAQWEQWQRDRRVGYLMAELFNALVATMVPGVVYQALEVHGERLVLKGVSADSGALDHQIRRLEQSSILSGVELMDVVDSQNRQYFRLGMNFQQQGDDATGA